MYGLSFDKISVIIACCEDIYGRFCMKKVTMITSTHYLLSRMNKLDCDFLYRKNLSLVCPLRNHVTLLLSHQSFKRVQRWRAS